MVQSLTLIVDGTLTTKLVSDIARQVNPSYLKRYLRRKKIPNVRCHECGTSTYDLTDSYEHIPTKDLTLKIQDNSFYGLASRAEIEQKLIVKAIALRRIRAVLKQRGVKSTIKYWDVGNAEFRMLVKMGLAEKDAERN